MQAPVRPVHIWVPCKVVSVERNPRRGDVWIPTTIRDGAAEKSVEISCPVESTCVRDRVMRDYVALVRSGWMVDVTVVR